MLAKREPSSFVNRRIVEINFRVNLHPAGIVINWLSSMSKNYISPKNQKQTKTKRLSCSGNVYVSSQPNRVIRSIIVWNKFHRGVVRDRGASIKASDGRSPRAIHPEQPSSQHRQLLLNVYISLDKRSSVVAPSSVMTFNRALLQKRSSSWTERPICCVTMCCKVTVKLKPKHTPCTSLRYMEYVWLAATSTLRTLFDTRSYRIVICYTDYLHRTAQ